MKSCATLRIGKWVVLCRGVSMACASEWFGGFASSHACTTVWASLGIDFWCSVPHGNGDAFELFDVTLAERLVMQRIGVDVRLLRSGGVGACEFDAGGER